MAVITEEAHREFGPFMCLRCGKEAATGAYWRGPVQRRGVGQGTEDAEVVNASAASCTTCLSEGFAGILLGDAFTADELEAVLARTEAEAYRIHAFHVDRGSR